MAARPWPGACVVSDQDTRVLLSDEEIAALPLDVQLVLGLIDIDELNRRIVLEPKQATTTSADVEAQIEAHAKLVEVIEEGNGGTELSELEILDSLAEDGIVPTGPEGGVDLEFVRREINPYGDHRDATRRPFDRRTRLKDTGQHGTLYRYRHGKCHCPECRRANAEYIREYRRRKRDGEV